MGFHIRRRRRYPFKTMDLIPIILLELLMLGAVMVLMTARW